ncbi:MAG: dihydrofolate reductase family protein, partial [candidate division Zixibacteria bacterium]|nr:dihydrofolate reductase family protein [candidate division Zixibacteria bacterium]
RKAMDFGFQSLLVEGGAELATSFVKSGLVDKYVVITAPVILGKGVNAIGELNVRTVADGIYFDDYMVEKSGGDCVFVGYPGRKVR